MRDDAAVTPQADEIIHLAALHLLVPARWRSIN